MLSFLQPALRLTLSVCRVLPWCLLQIEDITRWREDMNFISSSGKTIFYERAQRVSKILFLPREIKFISSSRRVMFFLLYRQNDIDKIMEGNYQNYVIDKLTCEMENKPLGSRM